MRKKAQSAAALILTGLLAAVNPMIVHAGEPDDYILITQVLDEYEVREGDSLWSISEKLLGDGRYYLQLAAQNADRIQDPDLIYPQMCLQVRQNVYVRKRTGADGLQTPEYGFGAPDGWRFGILQAGDVYANSSFAGDGMADVVCLIRDKEPAGEAALSDWAHSEQVICAYVRQNYADRISDLTFYDYETADKRSLHLFSYTYTIDGKNYGYRGSMDIYVCAGICQTEHIQAEFTGFDTDEGIRDIVLSMLAGFEELPGAAQGSANDYNMAIVPSETWALSGIHNPFVWIDRYFDSVFTKIAEADKPAKEKTAKERILGL